MSIGSTQLARWAGNNLLLVRPRRLTWDSSIRQHIGRADAVKEARQHTSERKGFHMPDIHSIGFYILRFVFINGKKFVYFSLYQN